MFKSLFQKDPALEAGRALYTKAVEQARQEPLYADFGTPDTVDGRFEMVALHVYLIMRRLKHGDPAAGEGKPDKRIKAVSQCLLDAMFQNMDDSLRELGVGDLVVSRKIRKLAENFYGRIGAYEAALGAAEPVEAISKALGRNIYSDEQAPDAPVLARYVQLVDRDLLAQPRARIAGGIVGFPTPALETENM